MLIRYSRLITRLALFSLALTGSCLMACGVSLVEILRRQPVDRTPIARLCFASAARALGLRVRCQGSVHQGTRLLVSNHISWSDIPVLGGVMPLRFLSKSEVRRWPIIGWLAAQAGTLFIRRGGGEAGKARYQIADTLRQGQSVLVFPEGTTSVGATVLPFHGRLLNAALDAGVALQPITISYWRQGRPDHLAPFVGDDDFHRHLWRLLKEPAADVSVVIHAPVSAHNEDSIQALTSRLEATVRNGLKSQPGDVTEKGAGDMPIHTG